MTKMKDQPWYQPSMKKYPTKYDKLRGLKFVPGQIYIAHEYYGGVSYWYCIKRSESGFIFFKQYYPKANDFGRDTVRRKPEKGWEKFDERVEINKGFHSSMIRGCVTGGATLYSRNLYKNKKTHKVPAPFGL